MSEEPKDLAADRAEKVIELQNAVGAFTTAFAVVESLYLTLILGLLSTDQPAMEHIEELMDFSDRLKLMLRLTKDRFPDQLAEAKAINMAGKTLAEHRNRIAHGAALVASGSFDPGAEFLVGIRKRKSERTVPTGFHWTDDAKGLMQMWFITTEEVRVRIDEAVALQSIMGTFQLPLQSIRFGTPAPDA